MCTAPIKSTCTGLAVFAGRQLPPCSARWPFACRALRRCIVLHADPVLAELRIFRIGGRQAVRLGVGFAGTAGSRLASARSRCAATIWPSNSAIASQPNRTRAVTSDPWRDCSASSSKRFLECMRRDE